MIQPVSQRAYSHASFSEMDFPRPHVWCTQTYQTFHCTIYPIVDWYRYIVMGRGKRRDSFGGFKYPDKSDPCMPCNKFNFYITVVTWPLKGSVCLFVRLSAGLSFAWTFKFYSSGCYIEFFAIPSYFCVYTERVFVRM